MPKKTITVKEPPAPPAPIAEPEEKEQPPSEETPKGLSLLNQVGMEELPSHTLVTLDPSDIYVPGEEILQADNTLVESIRTIGLLQPAIVFQLTQPRDGKHYQVFAGRRRTLAKRELKQPIDCLLLDRSTPGLEYLIVLSENFVRSHTEGMAWVRTVESLRKLGKIGVSEKQLYAMGLKKQTLSTYLEIARLPDAIFERIQAGQISFGNARMILKMTESERGKVVAMEKVTADAIRELRSSQIDTGLSSLFGAEDFPEIPKSSIKVSPSIDVPTILTSLETVIAGFPDNQIQTLATLLVKRIQSLKLE